MPVGVASLPRLVALSLAATLLPSAALAQSPEKTTATVTTEATPNGHTAPLPPDSTTESSVTLASGKSLAYTAVAGLIPVGATDLQDANLSPDGHYLPSAAVDLPLKSDDQPPTAHIFYTAYFAKGANPATRPITFVYNGGPGSASMYLRMTSFGPVRIDLPDLEHPVGGPYKYGPNPETLLDATDLVFIDAPGTGYSRILGKDAPKAFYGVDGDAAAFDRFIRRFFTKFNRWQSPRYLFGESYGTTRSAVLSAVLSQHGVDLNGVILLSQILSFDDSIDSPSGHPGTENAYFLALPSFAATAWFHHRVPNQPADLEPFLRQVEQYALTDYATALLQGSDLDPARKQAVAAKLESFTGVPASLWIKTNLRLSGGRFSRYLQDATDTTTGRLDSRYKGPALDPLSSDAEYDPFDSVTSSILSGMVAYSTETLHFGGNMTYLPGAEGAGEHWIMEHKIPGAQGPDPDLNVEPDLAYTLKINPRMHVLLMGGYFDLGCTYFAAQYQMKHLPIPADLQKNIEYTFFQSGHMVYIKPEALKGLHDRTAAFIQASATPH